MKISKFIVLILIIAAFGVMQDCIAKNPQKQDTKKFKICCQGNKLTKRPGYCKKFICPAPPPQGNKDMDYKPAIYLYPNGEGIEKRKPAIYLYPNGNEAVEKKPAVYLYSPKPLKVHITLDKSVLISYDAPKYAPSIGWNVLVYPDGKVEDLQPQYTDCNKLDKNKFGLEYAPKACKENNYPYIFWEGETTRKPVPDSKEGWVVETGNLQGFFNEKLDYIGFNKAEKEEFIRYWTTVLAEKQVKSYFIYFLQTKEVNELAPMTVEPKPTSINRIYMVANPLKDKIPTRQPQKLEKFKRKGFTLVEWGGSIKY